MANRKPTSVQDALNYRFYMDRLDDPGLLDRAVITEDGDLAVPVGGKRRGGYVGAVTRAVGRHTVRQLSARPDDFPDARLFYADGCGWLIEWGPGLNWRGGDYDAAAGRYYGYSETAIATFPERWLPVPGYEGLYEVSTYGNVMSRHRQPWRVLRPGRHKAGYGLVVLCKDGAKTSRTVHSLVLEAFTGPCPPGMESRHLDGNPANNRWAPGETEDEVRANGGNLFYGTGRQNNLDQVAHGTHNKASLTGCTKGHEYTEENTLLVLNPDGSVRQRRCRTCDEAKSAHYRALEAQAPASDEERCTDPEGCDRRKVAKELCRKHYARKWRAEREPANAA